MSDSEMEKVVMAALNEGAKTTRELAELAGVSVMEMIIFIHPYFYEEKIQLCWRPHE